MRYRIIFFFVVLGSLAQSEDNYPSLPSRILSTYTPAVVEDSSPSAIASRGKQFLSSLDQDRLAEAQLSYDSPEKARWTNVPPRGPQGGVRLGDLNEEQIKLAMDLLATALSPQGYYKARGIPLADDRLLRRRERRPGFGAEDYWLAIFGQPSADEPWALQFDGHHLAINLAFHGQQISMSPTFIGTQPRDFELGGKQIEPMAGKDDVALELMKSLTESQQAEAMQGKRRGNLAAGAGRDGKVPTPVGVSAESFTDAQQDAVIQVIMRYVGDLPEPYAEQRIAELKSEIDQMHFAWWGPVQDGGDYSYRLQGPSLIIEFAGQDLGGDPHQHLHSIYRDPTNEYGAGHKATGE